MGSIFPAQPVAGDTPAPDLGCLFRDGGGQCAGLANHPALPLVQTPPVPPAIITSLQTLPSEEDQLQAPAVWERVPSLWAPNPPPPPLTSEPGRGPWERKASLRAVSTGA